MRNLVSVRRNGASRENEQTFAVLMVRRETIWSHPKRDSCLRSPVTSASLSPTARETAPHRFASRRSFVCGKIGHFPKRTIGCEDCLMASPLFWFSFQAVQCLPRESVRGFLFKAWTPSPDETIGRNNTHPLTPRCHEDVHLFSSHSSFLRFDYEYACVFPRAAR